MTPSKAILFDYDGVLVASEPIHLLAWMQLLDELNLPKDQELILQSVGKTAPEIILKLLQKYQPTEVHSLEKCRELAQRKNFHYLNHARTALTLYPGVLDGLQWLHSEGIPTAIVSNGRRKEIYETTEFLGIRPWIKEIITRDDVTAHKPDPTPYEYAAALFEKSPSECIALEDSPTGLESALLAKIPSVALLTSFSKEALQNPVPGRGDLRPHWIFNSIEEFFRALRAGTL